jgi:thioesterase domain-containing protein
LNTAEFLNELRGLDVRIQANGGRLQFNAPVGVLTPELRERLAGRKQEILEFLSSASALANQQAAIVPINARGTRIPIFAVPGHNGDVFCYRTFAAELGTDQPLFGLQPPGLDGASKPMNRVTDLAEYFARQIRATRPPGPVIVAGFCAGGGIALELACQLRAAGIQVAMLAVFGSPFPKAYRFWSMFRIRLLNLMERNGAHWRTIRAGTPGGAVRYARERVRALWNARAARRVHDAQVGADPVLAMRRSLETTTLRALAEYEPRKFDGPAVLFLPSERWRRIGDNARQWRTVAADYREFIGPESCTGENILLEPHVRLIADFFKSKRPD